MRSHRFGSSIFDDPVEQCVDSALAHNLNHFEINLAPKHSHLHTFTKTRIAHLKHLSQKHGFSYSFHPSSSINLGHSVTYLRQKHISHIVKCINIGAQLGITHITLHLGNFGGHTIMNYFRQEALKKVIKSLNTLIKISSEHQILLAIENSASLHNGSDTQMLGDNINDFKIIFNQIDSPWLGFCLDIGHANLNEGAVKYIEHFSEKIKCVHYHDNYGYQDQHLEIGNGTVNWEDIIKDLKKIEYKGPFISECFKIRPNDATALFFKYWETE